MGCAAEDYFKTESDINPAADSFSIISFPSASRDILSTPISKAAQASSKYFSSNSFSKTRALAAIPLLRIVGKPTSARLSQLRQVALVLIVLQILDGVFTSIGVAKYGLEIEANILIRNLIASIGCIPALVTVKLLTVSAIISLCVVGASGRIRWLIPALRGVAIFYILFALLPWFFVFASDALAATIP